MNKTNHHFICKLITNNHKDGFPITIPLHGSVQESPVLLKSYPLRHRSQTFVPLIEHVSQNGTSHSKICKIGLNTLYAMIL